MSHKDHLILHPLDLIHHSSSIDLLQEFLQHLQDQPKVMVKGHILKISIKGNIKDQESIHLKVDMGLQARAMDPLILLNLKAIPRIQLMDHQ